MSSKRWLAIVLSTVLSISACLPVSAIGAYAADAGSTQESAAVAVEAVDTAVFGDEAAEEAVDLTAAGELTEEDTEETGDDEEAGTAEPSEAAASDDGDAGQEAVSEDEFTEEPSDEEADPAETAVGQEAGSAQDAASGERITTEEGGTPESADEAEEDSDSAVDNTGTDGEPALPAGTEEEPEELVEEADKEQVQTPARAAAAEDFANAVELTETGPVQVEVTEEAPCAYLKFTPGEDSGYAIYALSEEHCDSYGTLYDESFEQITENDDGGEGNHFRIRYVLEAGHTYYLEVRQYSYQSAVFTVYVEKVSFVASRVGESNVTASPGEEVTFAVSARSDSALHYQWVRDDDVLEGETKAQCTVVADGYHYIYCNVWDESGESETIWFNLYVENHLQAYVAGTEDDGSNIYAAPGETVDLDVDVSADDESELRFQWYKNWEEIEGETGTSFTTEAVTEYAAYEFQVSDQYGNSRTVYFYVSLENHLEAYAEGTDNTDLDVYVTPGETVDLDVDVSADDESELRFQWYKNWEEIEGAVGTSFTTEAVTEYAEYEFRVRDQYGNSRTVCFYVHPENHLEAYAEGTEDTDISIYVTPGETTDLGVDVSADDESGWSFQWYKDWSEIEGATGTSCTTDAVTEYTVYQFQVRDKYGNRRTVYFYVRPENHLEAYAEGTDHTGLDVYVTPGETAELGVDVSADDESGLRFQWYKNWEEIEGETGTSFTTEAVTEYAEYEFGVSDQFANGCTVYFYVYPENHLKAWPEGNEEGDSSVSLTVGPGKTKTLRVMTSADNTEGLTYQWYDDDSWEEFEGETSDTFTASGGGYFACRVRDVYGNEAKAYFYLEVDNDLQVYPEGSTNEEDNSISITIEAGKTKTLKTIATAEDAENLTFQWYWEDKEDDWTWKKLEGETSDTLSTPVSTRGDWQCRVEDGYGNERWAYFFVSVDNHLEIRQEGNSGILSGYRMIHLKPGETTTLRATAAALVDKDLRFTWDKDGEEIEGETMPSLTVTADKNVMYRCWVEDPYENSERVIFDLVIDNYLEAHPTGMRVGETAKDYDAPAEAGELLSVTASALDPSKISYAWQYYSVDEDEWMDIEGETGTSHEIRAEELQQGFSSNFRCLVRDTFGNSQIVSFWFPSGSSEEEEYTLDAWPENAGMQDGSRENFVILDTDGAQDEVTLRVITEATDPSGLRYYWYDYDWGPVDQNGQDQLTVSPLGSSRYICEITDGHGNWEDVYFYLRSNAFWAYPEGAESRRDTEVDVQLDVGETHTLKAIVSGTDLSGVSYQWEEDYEPLPGETKAELAITGSGRKTYTCAIEDGFGNFAYLYYYVSVGELKLTHSLSDAEIDGRYAYLYLKPGAKIKLKCDVQSVPDAKLSYEWIDRSGDDSVLGRDTTLEVTADRRRTVRLLVSDQYGNRDYLFFYIRLNHLKVSADTAGSSPTWTDQEETVWYLAEAEQGATLKVQVEADDTSALTYRWYDSYYDALAAKGTDTIVVNPGGKNRYYCEVADQYGNEDEVYFSVLNDSGLTACPADRESTEYNSKDNRSTLYAEKGTALTLKVEASVTDGSALKYFWQSRELKVSADGSVDEKAAASADGWKDLAESTDSLAVTAEADVRYLCTVEDLYGKRVTVSFDILPSAMIDLSKASVTFSQKSWTYSGKAWTPAPVVKLDGKTLTAGDDYKVEYKNNVEIGTATVTVTGQGRYTGTAKGTFTIAAPEKVAVTKLYLNKTKAEIATTKTLQLTAKPVPENAVLGSVTWTSSDTSIATVDKNGLVKAKKYGKCTITAKSANGETATCEIQTRFNDVNNSGKSYYTPVYWAVDKGITVCTVTFRPDDPVTRGEFVAFLWRVAGKPKSSAKVSFKDVNSKTKFYDAIRWAVGKGIIKGYGDGTFKSENNVTRGETATMIWRYAGKPNPKTKKSPFSDIKASSADSYKAILWGSENGIIKGSGGKFLKNDGCTRGQVVTFLYRYKH